MYKRQVVGVADVQMLEVSSDVFAGYEDSSLEISWDLLEATDVDGSERVWLELRCTSSCDSVEYVEYDGEKLLVGGTASDSVWMIPGAGVSGSLGVGFSADFAGEVGMSLVGISYEGGVSSEYGAHGSYGESSKSVTLVVLPVSDTCLLYTSPSPRD